MKWLSPLAIVLSGAALAVVWLTFGGLDRSPPAARSAGVSVAVASAALHGGAPALQTQVAAAGIAARPVVLGGTAPVPPGVSAEQWQQIVAEHAGKPDGAAELRRLADYFHFADTLQRFRQLRKSPTPGAELTSLAMSIDRTLDTRVQHGEVNGAEARAIKAAVLEVLQPDEAARQIALRQWQASAAPTVPLAAEARARDAEFLRQQAALVAAWSARAPAERDQGALERDLAALKQATYATPGERAATPVPPRRTP